MVRDETEVNTEGLRYEVARRGWKASQLAAAAGIGLRTAKELINGKRLLVRRVTAIRVAQAFSETKPLINGRYLAFRNPGPPFPGLVIRSRGPMLLAMVASVAVLVIAGLAAMTW